MSYVRFPVPSRLTSTTPSSAPSITNCVAICAGRSRIGAPRGALVVRAARAEHAQLRECSGVGVGVAGVVERVQPPRSLPAGPRARAGGLGGEGCRRRACIRSVLVIIFGSLPLEARPPQRRVETAAQSVKMARKTGVTQVALELGEELNEDLACCTEG
ncbi:hypothetical protein BJ912DRAFT_934661 [Pholiota molesta]|nr:hypothetical protein BJ912DRAFT_934661 [Pholiota molesta]